jgi:hypothetical protein
MADAYTQKSSVSVDQAAFDRLAYFALRSELLFDAVADVTPTQQAMPGSTVTFTIFNDLAAATSTLTETSDVDAVALSDSQVSVTLNEYGNAVLTTAALRGTPFPFSKQAQTSTTEPAVPPTQLHESLCRLKTSSLPTTSAR